jgi:hypothetical protein
MEKIIRLVDPELVGPYPVIDEYFREKITVVRKTYSEDLMAFFLRSKAGVLLLVNETLTTQDQAIVISFAKRKIYECGTVEIGVIKKGLKYFCGGTGCKECYCDVI